MKLSRDQSAPESLFGEFTPALLLRCYIRRSGQPDDIPIHFDVDPLPPWLSYPCVFPWYRITLPVASVPKIPLFISSCLLEMIKVISMRAGTMGDPSHFRAGGPPSPIAASFGGSEAGCILLLLSQLHQGGRVGQNKG